MPRARSYPPDHPIFHGPKHKTQPADYPDLERERTFIHDANLKKELLEVAGSEIELEIALRRAEQEPIRKTADSLGLNASTISRRGRQALTKIRVGILAKIVSEQVLRFGRILVNSIDAKTIEEECGLFAVSFKDTDYPLHCIPDWKWISTWLRKRWSLIESPVEYLDCCYQMPHIHCWFGNGKGSISVAFIVKGEAEAIAIAKANRQPFIVDIATGKMSVI